MRSVALLALAVATCFDAVAGSPGVDEDVSPHYDLGDTAVFSQNARRGLVTVVFANLAYLEQGLIQNMLCSWGRIPYPHYVLVAVDEAASAGVAKLSPGQTHWHPPYWRGIGSGLLRPTNQKTPEYVAFIHKRTRFVEALLLLTNLDVLLCDADTVFFRDPLADGTVPFWDPDSDRCDAFVVNSAHRGGKGPDRVEPLGGFIAVRNNARSRLWYRTWTAMEACLQSKEQPAMHASLRVLDARFARAYQYRADLEYQVYAATQPVLCVLHDAHYPTGFHMTDGYLKDYPDTSYITLGHASIPEKTNKQPWMAELGWWFLGPDGQCPAPRGGGGAVAAPRPSKKKLEPSVKHLAVVHWKREGPDGRDCTRIIAERVPGLKLQVADALAKREQRRQQQHEAAAARNSSEGDSARESLGQYQLPLALTVVMILFARMFRLHRYCLS
ncbi:hypothetical protein DIPPA_10809 [Diplonema papillatum]|nr:hypothetical protein DIPPA_10809 [Diplonema papillatum]